MLFWDLYSKIQLRPIFWRVNMENLMNKKGFICDMEGALGGDQSVYFDENGKTLLIVYGE